MYYSKTQERFSSEDKKSAVRQVVVILKSVGKKYKEMIKQQTNKKAHLDTKALGLEGTSPNCSAVARVVKRLRLLLVSFADYLGTSPTLTLTLSPKVQFIFFV